MPKYNDPTDKSRLHMEFLVTYKGMDFWYSKSFKSAFIVIEDIYIRCSLERISRVYPEIMSILVMKDCLYD